jgi:antitoxin component YwqK of YwqJK toxin-antitoxin module
VEFDRAGQLIREEAYWNGQLTGLSREWYSSEKLRAEEPLLSGGRHGEYKEWFENGQLRFMGKFEHAIALETFEWDEHGNEVEHFVLTPEDHWYKLLLLKREVYAKHLAARAGTPPGPSQADS